MTKGKRNCLVVKCQERLITRFSLKSFGSLLVKHLVKPLRYNSAQRSLLSYYSITKYALLQKGPIYLNIFALGKHDLLHQKTSENLFGFESGGWGGDVFHRIGELPAAGGAVVTEVVRVDVVEQNKHPTTITQQS